MHAPTEHNHNLKNCARPSEHIAQSHGNNVINNGIYIDSNKVRGRVEDEILHSVLAHEKAHGHIQKRVMHEVAHKVDDRLRHELSHHAGSGHQFESEVNNLFGQGPGTP